jgi:hypothetical protein
MCSQYLNAIAAQAVVDWFLHSMPATYFRQTTQEARLEHLQAIRYSILHHTTVNFCKGLNVAVLKVHIHTYIVACINSCIQNGCVLPVTTAMHMFKASLLSAQHCY